MNNVVEDIVSAKQPTLCPIEVVTLCIAKDDSETSGIIHSAFDTTQQFNDWSFRDTFQWTNCKFYQLTHRALQDTLLKIVDVQPTNVGIQLQTMNLICDIYEQLHQKNTESTLYAVTYDTGIILGMSLFYEQNSTIISVLPLINVIKPVI